MCWNESIASVPKPGSSTPVPACPPRNFDFCHKGTCPQITTAPFSLGPSMRHIEQSSPANLQTWECENKYFTLKAEVLGDLLCSILGPRDDWYSKAIDIFLLNHQMKKFHYTWCFQKSMNCDNSARHQVWSLVFPSNYTPLYNKRVHFQILGLKRPRLMC